MVNDTKDDYLKEEITTLTRNQRNKLQFLLERGGKWSSSTIHVGMPDGSTADIDPFGKVTWRGL